MALMRRVVFASTAAASLLARSAAASVCESGAEDEDGVCMRAPGRGISHLQVKSGAVGDTNASKLSAGAGDLGTSVANMKGACARAARARAAKRAARMMQKRSAMASATKQDSEACHKQCGLYALSSNRSSSTDSTAPPPEPPVPVQHCADFCHGTCACLPTWQERCLLKSCGGCAQCEVAEIFAAEVDYHFPAVCPGQSPVAPKCASDHLSIGKDKFSNGGCGADEAKDIVIEYENTCNGPGAVLVNTCYAATDYDVTISIFTWNDGMWDCNDDVGDKKFCHDLTASAGIPDRYLISPTHYVQCPPLFDNTHYGDGTGSIRCSAMGYDMAPNELVRVVVSSYSTTEGNFKICNRIFDGM